MQIIFISAYIPTFIIVSAFVGITTVLSVPSFYVVWFIFGNALLKCETQPFIKQLILLVKFCVVWTSEPIYSRHYYCLLQMLRVTKSWYSSIYYFHFRGIKCSIVKNQMQLTWFYTFQIRKIIIHRTRCFNDINHSPLQQKPMIKARWRNVTFNIAKWRIETVVSNYRNFIFTKNGLYNNLD